MHKISLTLALSLCASALPAQLAVVIPNGTGAAAGNSSNAFPWGNNAATWPGLRLMCVYDASNFTAQGITSPIMVNRLRWRPDNNASAVTGGTYTTGDVRLSTAPMDYSGLTSNFAGNHGPDLTTVYSGAVTHAATPGAGLWTVNSWCVDITLTTPFLYDPNAGDLVIDCDYPGGSNYVGGAPGQMDVQSTGSSAGRVWASTNYPAANGSELNHGVVVEVGYAPAAGYATAISYGAGCYDRAAATVYELFNNGTFDLANTTLQFTPTGNGYVVLPGVNQWWTPVGTNLGLADDSVSAALPLGFTLNYPGGSTNDVYASSNGFVWAQSSTVNGCCAGVPADLCNLGARWCPLWNDLNPAAGGSVVFDTDPANGAAYLTYTNVPEYGTSNLVNVQVAFFSTGQVEYRYQACAVANHVVLTGWSPGNGTQNPGSVDLSLSLPIVTEPDQVALHLGASPRPVVGNNVVLLTSNIPAGSPLGVCLFGLAQLNPGLSLASLGAPGCFQFLGIDGSVVFLPSGTTGSMVFPVPNNAVFNGVHVGTQSAVFAAGANQLGVVTSNGLDLTIGIQ